MEIAIRFMIATISVVFPANQVKTGPEDAGAGCQPGTEALAHHGLRKVPVAQHLLRGQLPQHLPGEVHLHQRPRQAGERRNCTRWVQKKTPLLPRVRENVALSRPSTVTPCAI